MINLEPSIRIQEKLKNIFLTVATSILFCSISLTLLKYFGGDYYNYWNPDNYSNAKHIITFTGITSACIIAPLWEECLWRYCTFEITRKMFLNFKEFQIPFIVLTGILFGYWHEGVSTVFVQGISGILFGFLYVKNGFSYWSTVAAHSLYNLSVMVILPNFIH